MFSVRIRIPLHYRNRKVAHPALNSERNIPCGDGFSDLHFFRFAPRKVRDTHEPQIMADIAKKGCGDGKVPTTQGQAGRSRKLAEWQNELLMSLDGRSGMRFRRVRFD